MDQPETSPFSSALSAMLGAALALRYDEKDPAVAEYLAGLCRSVCALETQEPPAAPREDSGQ